MIFYKNYGPRLRTKQDEVEAIRRCVGREAMLHDGTPAADPFELIELVKRKGSPIPTKIHGYQDTDVTREQTGDINIVHRRPGEGTLRFEPNPYGNPVGYLARTEHNIKTLVHSFRANEWTITDRATAEEVKKAYEKWWSELSESDKKKIVYQEELKTRDRYSLPTQSGPAKTDHSTEKFLKEIAELKEANRQQAELLSEKYGESPPADPVEKSVPELKPEPTLTPESHEPVSPAPPEEKTDPWVITQKNGEALDFRTMKTFSVRGLARKYGLHFAASDTKEIMVPKIIEKIKYAEAQENAV